MTTTMASRVLRWAGRIILIILCVRGTLAAGMDILRWGISNDHLRHIATGARWTAFELCIDYTIIADRDTVLYMARSIDDRSTWFRIAPTDTRLTGSIEWVTPQHLRIPALYRDGCLRGLDDVVIEWAP